MNHPRRATLLRVAALTALGMLVVVALAGCGSGAATSTTTSAAITTTTAVSSTSSLGTDRRHPRQDRSAIERRSVGAAGADVRKRDRHHLD